MKRLTVKANATHTQRNKPLAPALDRVLTGEGLAVDLRLVSERLECHHPYLAYVHAKQLDDDAIMERQTEIISAIGGALKSSFGAVKGAVTKVTSSTRFIPGWAAAIGLGPTWGALAGFFIFDWVFTRGSEEMSNTFSLNLKGISDRDGLEAKIAEIPPNTTFKVKDKVWMWKSPMVFYDAADQIDALAKFCNKLTVMSDKLPAVMNGQISVSHWLQPLEAKTDSTWVIPPLHKNIGFMVYKNNDRFFLEEVVSAKKFASAVKVPKVMEMMVLQKAARRLDAAGQALDKTLKRRVKALEKGEAASEEAAFAANTLKVLYETTMALSTAALKDAKHLLQDTIANIVSFRTEDAPITKEDPKADEATDKTGANPKDQPQGGMGKPGKPASAQAGAKEV